MSERNTPYAGSARTPIVAGGVALALLLLTGGVVTVASNIVPAGNSAPGPVAALELPAPSPSPSKVFERLPDIPVPEKTEMAEAPAPVVEAKPGLVQGTESLSKDPVGFPPAMPAMPEGTSTDPKPPTGAMPPPPENTKPTGTPPPSTTTTTPPSPGTSMPPAPPPAPCPQGQECKPGEAPPDPNAPPPPPTDCPPNGLPCVTEEPNPSPTGPPPGPQPELGECESYDPMAQPCPTPTDLPDPVFSPVPMPTPTDLCTEDCDTPPEPEYTGQPGGSFNGWDWTVKIKACDGVTPAKVGEIANDKVTAQDVYGGQCNYMGEKVYVEAGYEETFGAAVGYYGAEAGSLTQTGTALAGLGDRALYNNEPAGLGLTIWKGDYATEVFVSGLGSPEARLDAAKKIGVIAIDYVTRLAPPIPPEPTAPSPYPGTTSNFGTPSTAGSTTANFIPASNSNLLNSDSTLVALTLMAMTTLAMGGLLTGTKIGLFAKAANPVK